MAATKQNIKDLFALTGNNDPVTDSQLTAADAWLEDHTGTSGPDALVDHLYAYLDQQVVSHKRATSTHSW
jgi:hypothetical protein